MTRKTLLEEQKIEETVERIPQYAFTVLDFIQVFKEVYPADWTRLVERYGRFGEKRRYTVTTYLSNRLDAYSKKPYSSLQPLTPYGESRSDYRRTTEEERNHFGSPWIAVFKKKSLDQSAAEFYAQTYDASVPDWPGEIDFYRELAAEAKSNTRAVLEVACGTGRIAVRLAQEGVNVVGLDLSAAMLDVAREKSAGLSNVRWLKGNMKSFELGETFGLVIIPGHSFQHMLTSEDQVACLECIQRHLAPGGVLVVHLDHQNCENLSWLGNLCAEKRGVFEAARELTHPKTGQLIRTSRAWSYEPSTQTAFVVTVWEEMDADGQVVACWERGPIRLHCVFRFEMEHLLARVGFEVEAVYGNFFRDELRDESTEMIWIVRN